TGVDFTHYRQSTILRRIQRRMVVHKIDRLDEYVKHLQSNPPELKALYRDMLINVTSFFRNPRAFDALKSHVFPAILKNHPPGASAASSPRSRGATASPKTFATCASLPSTTFSMIPRFLRWTSSPAAISSSISNLFFRTRPSLYFTTRSARAAICFWEPPRV